MIAAGYTFTRKAYVDMFAPIQSIPTVTVDINNPATTVWPSGIGTIRLIQKDGDTTISEGYIPYIPVFSSDYVFKGDWTVSGSPVTNAMMIIYIYTLKTLPQNLTDSTAIGFIGVGSSVGNKTFAGMDNVDANGTYIASVLGVSANARVIDVCDGRPFGFNLLGLDQNTIPGIFQAGGHVAAQMPFLPTRADVTNKKRSGSHGFSELDGSSIVFSPSQLAYNSQDELICIDDEPDYIEYSFGTNTSFRESLLEPVEDLEDRVAALESLMTSVRLGLAGLTATEHEHYQSLNERVTALENSDTPSNLNKIYSQI